MPLDAAMLVHSTSPLNAEPPLDRLRESFLTPQSLMYVRSHGPVPHPGSRLTVQGLVARPMSLPLDELRQRFATVSLTATLQCAGNRRADLQGVAKTSGDPWAPGAILNAEWTGVRLADVLAEAGIEPAAAHVAFLGRDHLASDEATRFAVSIPLAKALSPEVMLSWGVNGDDLAREHGGPLRAVVPGYAGVRSAKWLEAIELRSDPADSPIQRRDYKLLPADISPDDADWDAAPTIDELPVNSAICRPHGPVPAGPCDIEGWAMASGRSVARVDVSADGGRTWRQAALQQQGSWAWTLWHARIDLPAGGHELVVRAWDSAGQTQPADPAVLWNCKGYLSAAWHRVRIVAG